MNIKCVVGAGYGDEGKGLMTDYFCNKLENNVLNVKVNGGAQAGHTVCRLDTGIYKHWVFRQYGSGSFIGADTYLARTFMLNIDELLKERKALQEIYNINTKMLICRDCRVTLPIHILLNRYIEDTRTNKHGSCGLGIYETFHMNKDFKSVTLRDLIHDLIEYDIKEFESRLMKLSEEYLDFRQKELIKTDNILISDKNKTEILEDCKVRISKLTENIGELAKLSDIIFIDDIDDAIEKYRYDNIVFECSQGLELDQHNVRNWPHLTPSNTGLKNVASLVNNSKILKKASIEICFVTRSYKTKHGAGLFLEEDSEIENQFNLYDRTNQLNKYQGYLKYGLVNIGRIKKLIVEQLEYTKEICNCINIGLCITHLDQTNGLILTNNGNLSINETFDKFGDIFTASYCSYGEKASDIIKIKQSN